METIPLVEESDSLRILGLGAFNVDHPAIPWWTAGTRWAYQRLQEVVDTQNVVLCEGLGFMPMGVSYKLIEAKFNHHLKDHDDNQEAVIVGHSLLAAGALEYKAKHPDRNLRVLAIMPPWGLNDPLPLQPFRRHVEGHAAKVIELLQEQDNQNVHIFVDVDDWVIPHHKVLVDIPGARFSAFVRHKRAELPDFVDQVVTERTSRLPVIGQPLGRMVSHLSLLWEPQPLQHIAEVLHRPNLPLPTLPVPPDVPKPELELAIAS